VATAIGCEAHEIVFTSGGTEANNMIIKGAVERARNLLTVFFFFITLQPRVE